MKETLFEYRYPALPYHNLPAGRQGLIDRAIREQKANGPYLPNTVIKVDFDSHERMFVVRGILE